jgi:hypothetical protein
MILYRICSDREVNLILDNDFSKVGSLGANLIEYQNEKGMNNHKYNPDKYYMHFYKDKGNVLFMNVFAGSYVCTYDLPDDMLEGKLRVGKYTGYFYGNNEINVCEYAIESEMIKKEYLQKIERTKEDICITDDDFPDSLDDFFEPVYVKTLKL